MDKNNLMDLKVRKLFEKFGKGNHKPGSGSAAAFQGMLSSHLTVTVISLTLDSDRIKYYLESKELLNKYKKRLEGHIIPRLEELFEEDSIQFDKVIECRNLRNQALDSNEKHNYEQKHLKQLKVATEIPIEIAELCIVVAEIASFVFTNGFQAARGDTCVAQSNSIAAVLGCISIIDLNLLSFMSDYWTKEKMDIIDGLTESYFRLNQSLQNNFFKLQKERSKRHLLQQEINGLVQRIKGKRTIKDDEIENLTRKIQNRVWKNKSYLWRKPPESPLDMLKPREEQNFTAAHELGHAILHCQPIIHRDRPLDGARNTNPKDPIEYQADRFATYFLMPTNQVREVFSQWFGVSKFILNEDNCFKHFNVGPSALRKQTKTLRGLALKLASHKKQHNGRYVSLSNIFKVSKTAMARRLEKLDLVEF